MDANPSGGINWDLLWLHGRLPPWLWALCISFALPNVDRKQSKLLDQQKFISFLLWNAREVARLHAEVAALRAAWEEMRVIDSRLDRFSTDQTQKDAWHEYLKKVEDFDPEIAALLDNRPPEAF
ncbi:MAG: hypothetical protein WAK51_15530 [Opitutaceae bacterium]